MNTTMNTAIALLKRETWEHKSFWLVPVSLAGLVFAAFLWAMFYAIPKNVGYELWVDRMARANPEAIERASEMLIPGTGAPFLAMMVFVIAFYLLDSLYSERRDRSILFWKSLPVTDTATVLSKWAAVLLVFPAIVFGVVAALSIVLTLLTGIFVMIGGGNAWTLVWQHFSLFSGLGTLLLFFYVQAMWFLPLFGWLLVASAWAKKAPFLWAVLPPLALVVLEEMFFDTNHFLHTVGMRLTPFEGSESIGKRVAHEFEMFDGHIQFDATPGLDISVIGELMASSGFWYGLLFAVACTVGAVWLRRYRDES